MKKGIFFIILLQLLCSFCACNSYTIPESVKYDFTIRGPITGDVFQAIITAKPGTNAITQHEQRESAFISARDQVAEEYINQMLEY